MISDLRTGTGGGSGDEFDFDVEWLEKISCLGRHAVSTLSFFRKCDWSRRPTSFGSGENSKVVGSNPALLEMFANVIFQVFGRYTNAPGCFREIPAPSNTAHGSASSGQLFFLIFSELSF